MVVVVVRVFGYLVNMNDAKTCSHSSINIRTFHAQFSASRIYICWTLYTHDTSVQVHIFQINDFNLFSIWSRMLVHTKQQKVESLVANLILILNFRTFFWIHHNNEWISSEMCWALAVTMRWFWTVTSVSEWLIALNYEHRLLLRESETE